MPSSSSSPSFTIPNIGTANLTAIIATSSLYIYLIALHLHQQKTLLRYQESRELEQEQKEQQERERVRHSQLQQAQAQTQTQTQTRYNNQREEYTTDPIAFERSRQFCEDQRQYYTNTGTNTYRTNPSTMSKTFSPSEVAAHSKDAEDGLYIIIDENVYDITNFLEEHPGGAKILKRVAGKDASKQFWKYHNEGVLKKYGEKLKIGSVGEKAKL
ncbi:hypothetical protein SBOR_1128 [Sclerotinia borealis F-4128]|uniref:Cytochrome b5 heme-binding domain-containing protein n=1 Tax=Sclerotinia borealis (strain F-4128) TaxID=1432307 RepID=W9CRI7_SCLBF|nr:hypothetical protein SBOR_1128 [Sclerotinia borealis F-4128]